MNMYSTYGLGIHSELPIPELLPCTSEADVVIKYGSLGRPDPEEMDDYYIVRVDGDTIYMFMEEVGAVEMKGGHSITIDPLPGAVEKGFRFFVTGMAMGALLHQRAIFTLHASAVDIGGKAIAFMGAKRMGKSTTAAALFRHGYPIVTDDMLVLDMKTSRRGIMVRPGYPHLKLWPESVAATLEDDLESLSKVHPEATKRVRLTTEGFSQKSLPLQCIYLLDAVPDSEVAITPVTDGEACLELIRHSYAVRILQKSGATPGHLQQCASLVKQVPIRRLNRAHSLSRLQDLVACIEADVAHLSSEITKVSPRTRSGAAV